MSSIPSRERVIVALDVPDLAGAEAFLDKLDGAPAYYKVGLELFVAEGARAIDAVKKRNGRVFLDLKLHDIPETVARAVQNGVAYGVDMMTIHTCGGFEMMRRAAEAAAGKTRILGVTVLTSLSDDDLRADGITAGTTATVKARAALAARAGIGGLVCSPLEVAEVKLAAPALVRVVPGVRPAGAAKGDQKRVATPKDAIAGGADYLVIGRPIRDAADPAQAFRDAVAEVEAA